MSLRVRLLAASAYVLVLAIVALEVPLALNLSRRVDTEVKSEAASGAQLVAASASGRLGRVHELERLTRTAALDLGGRVILTNRQGRLVADSAGTGLRRADYGTRPEVSAALSGRIAQGERHSNSLNEDLLYTAVPVIRRDRPAGAVRVTQSVEAVNSEVRSDILAFVGIGAAVLLLGLGLAWLLAGSIARPLHALSGTARRIAAGNLDERAETTGSKEQREVAAAFNLMTRRLADALASQRDFVANASHQLRTPLTGLRLRLEAAAIKSSDPSVQHEIEAAERETERLASLLKGLLALARERTRPPDVMPLPLGPEVEAAVERWRGPARQKGQHIVLEQGMPCRVCMSADDLAVVLDNLIENAMEYSPQGTEVTIESHPAGEWAQIAVTDRGPGLPPVDEERAFERFFRGSAAASHGAGAGLGLPIVRALAEGWGGTATIRNRDGGGARAEVLLPALSGNGALPKVDRELDEALPGRA